jgi:ribosomal protein S27E
MARGARTNVPVWPRAAPPLPPGAVRWIIFDLGAAPVADGWIAEAGRRGVDAERIPLAVPLNPIAWDEQTRMVGRSRVGVRIAVCGPEADVLLVRAYLLGEGLLDEEVLVHATSNHEIRVRCAHCGSSTRHVARPGDVVPCEPCGYDEIVHHHFSRRIAGYLGFRADADAPR